MSTHCGMNFIQVPAIDGKGKSLGGLNFEIHILKRESASNWHAAQCYSGGQNYFSLPVISEKADSDLTRCPFDAHGDT